MNAEQCESETGNIISFFSVAQTRPCLKCLRHFLKWQNTYHNEFHISGRLRTEIIGNGDSRQLKIAANNLARQHIREMMVAHETPPVMSEPQILHSAGLSVLRPEDIGVLTALRPEDIGVLTAAPLAADNEGNIWWHERYQIECLSEELYRFGRVYLNYMGDLFETE